MLSIMNNNFQTHLNIVLYMFEVVIDITMHIVISKKHLITILNKFYSILGNFKDMLYEY